MPNDRFVSSLRILMLAAFLAGSASTIKPVTAAPMAASEDPPGADKAIVRHSSTSDVVCPAKNPIRVIVTRVRCDGNFAVRGRN